MAEITMENVEGAFGRMKTPENVKPIVELVEKAFLEMAKTILLNVPRSAHRSAALRDLLVAKWTCIDSIVKGGLI
jgi:3-dehydroquinate dehydratase